MLYDFRLWKRCDCNYHFFSITVWFLHAKVPFCVCVKPIISTQHNAPSLHCAEPQALRTHQMHYIPVTDCCPVLSCVTPYSASWSDYECRFLLKTSLRLTNVTCYPICFTCAGQVITDQSLTFVTSGERGGRVETTCQQRLYLLELKYTTQTACTTRRPFIVKWIGMHSVSAFSVQESDTHCTL